MSVLVTLENVFLAYGLSPLLDEAKLQINSNERICLIGRNGVGKSSLLKIIDDTIQPNEGFVWRKPQIRISKLEQNLPDTTAETVYDFVAEGIASLSHLLKEYHQITKNLSEHSNNYDLSQLSKIQNLLDHNNGWQFDHSIKSVLTRLELQPEQKFSELSGGWQRRAAYARAIISQPDILLLDEPTNHLDIEAIEHLEQELLCLNSTIVFITHDRTFLRKLATRIVELDRGQLTSWPGDYDNFLRRKEELLHAEQQANSQFDKKLSQEEKWIRQGIKARRTRNEGRVRALKSMRKARSERREQERFASFELNQADRSGQLVFELENVTHHSILKQLSLRIMRGDRIGLIGKNGVGKTTFLNILLGKIKPESGILKVGTNLQIAYFDQGRQTLDSNKTVIENVIEGSDFIDVNNSKVHVISYLTDFLFTPIRSQTPVKALSGGECNRLLLAKLFAKPANVIILDEPTNDLDVETLELLEEKLIQFQGTIILTSHDREFIDNIVTSVLIFEGDGKITEHVSSYYDWHKIKKLNSDTVKIKSKQTTSEKTTTRNNNNKLSYKELNELNSLPRKIETLEIELQQLQIKINDSNFYKQKSNLVKEVLSNITNLQFQIDNCYSRWQELEDKQFLAKS